MRGRTVIGIDLGGTKCHGALADASGRILAEARRATRGEGGAVTAVLGVWDELAAAAAEADTVVDYTVVGVPAVVDLRSGHATRGPNVGWTSLDVTSSLSALGEHLSVENDVNLAALGEHRSGTAVGIDDFAVLSIGTGFGGALVVGGRTVLGYRGGAGEFGETVVAPIEGTTGRAPRLEDLVSGTGIEAAAERALAGRTRPASGFGRSAKSVLAAAAHGDSEALEIVDPVLARLASLVVNLSCIVDPRLIVLDGSIGRAMAPLLPKLGELLAEQISEMPDIRVSELAPTSTVRGALVRAAQLAGLSD